MLPQLFRAIHKLANRGLTSLTSPTRGTTMAPIKLWELAGADPQRVFSPFCWASRLAVLHKGLEYESVPWCAPGRACASCSLMLPVRLGGGAFRVPLIWQWIRFGAVHARAWRHPLRCAPLGQAHRVGAQEVLRGREAARRVGAGTGARRARSDTAVLLYGASPVLVVSNMAAQANHFGKAWASLWAPSSGASAHCLDVQTWSKCAGLS